jgi:hypothetical protein
VKADPEPVRATATNRRPRARARARVCQRHLRPATPPPRTTRHPARLPEAACLECHDDVSKSLDAKSHPRPRTGRMYVLSHRPPAAARRNCRRGRALRYVPVTRRTVGVPEGRPRNIV